MCILAFYVSNDGLCLVAVASSIIEHTLTVVRVFSQSNVTQQLTPVIHSIATSDVLVRSTFIIEFYLFRRITL